MAAESSPDLRAAASRRRFDAARRSPHNHPMDGPAPLFDRALLDRRQRRALLGSRPDADFLLTTAVDDLIDRLTTVKRVFARAADIATPLPLLADRLIETGQVEAVVRLERFAGRPGDHPYPVVVGDEEMLPFLLGIGIRRLSIDPQFMPAVHRRIAGLAIDECRAHAQELTAAGSIEAVQRILGRKAEKH